MADILNQIAQGPAPVQPVNVLGNAAAVANIQAQRAQTAETQARIPQIAAQTDLTRAQIGVEQQMQHGAELDNVLKQRNVTAQQALVGLLQKNTSKLPDGSTATNMGNVIGEYRSLYPDKALELEQKSLEVEAHRSTVAQNQFNLASAQQKHVGFSLATAGFTDPDAAAKDPQIVAKFNDLYQQAQKDGTAQLIGVTPQQFAQNPSAYIPKLSNLVNQSGAKADALEQASKQVDLRVKQLGEVRTAFAQGMQNVSTPEQYKALVASIGENFDPHVVASANLAPPNTVTSPQAIAATKQAAALTQMDPKERVTYLESVRHNTAQEASQRLTAAAEASKANTAAGELSLKRSLIGSDEPAAPTGGVSVPQPVPVTPAAGGGAPMAPTQAAPYGRNASSLTPPINGPRATAQLAQAPAVGQVPQAPGTPQPAPVATAPAQAAPAAPVTGGKNPVLTVDGKQIDLNGNTPIAREWQSAPKLVRDTALRLLSGNDGGGGAGMAGLEGMAVSGRAVDLASKINPHYAAQAEARKDSYGTQAQTAILAANTAISHSDNLLKLAAKLGDTNFRPIKTVELIKNAMTGKEEPTDFENVRDAYVRELGKYFAGGQMGEGEFNVAASRIAAANSLTQLKGAVRENNKLLMGGMKEREQQFNDLNNGAILGNRQKFITPDSRKILKSQGLVKAVNQAQLSDYAKKNLGGDTARAIKEAKDKGYEIED